MDNKYQKLLLIQTSACFAETFTYPIDYIKTLMQVNKSKIKFFSLLKQNRFDIYNGLKPALLRHCIYTTLRISIYEELKKTQSTTDDLHLSTKMLFGGISGAIGQFIASPFDLLKVQYITNNNNNKTIISNIRHIIKKNGIIGLWKGVTPNVSRALLVNLGELATYDHSKKILKKYFEFKEGTYLHIISSICSGFTAALCCTPADVIKSRLMQKNSKYTGVVDCIKTTIHQEGPFALYKGFLPIWLRLAPWQLSFWVSYEKLRYFSGLEEF